MATSRQALVYTLVLAATLAVLFVGSADAWYKCQPGYASCKPRGPGCETCIFKDPFNCGKCGLCCPQYPNSFSPCKYGKCCPPTCKPGYGNCDGIWKNGCEKSLWSDPFNCGKCGSCCPQYPNAITPCKYGKCCPPSCKPGYGDCDGNWKNGCEKSLWSDPFNCGKCGYCCLQYPNAITPCKYGKCCPPSCKPGYGDCDGNWKNGCEKSLWSDPFNCGKCGYCCPQYPNAISFCKDGQCCPPVCKPGYGDCDKDWTNGCEKSLSSDIFNCGKCGYCCPVTLKGGEATCSAGVCGQQCKSGFKYDGTAQCCVPFAPPLAPPTP